MGNERVIIDSGVLVIGEVGGHQPQSLIWKSGNQELQIQGNGVEGCNFPAKARRSLRVIEYF